MLKSFNILNLLLFFIPPLQSQPIMISGSLDTLIFKEVHLYKYEIRKTAAFDPRIDITIPIETNGKFKGSFKIASKGFYKLGDLLRGHLIFLSPGDSIFISFKKNPDSVRSLMHTFYKVEPYSEYPGNISFFDEMTRKFSLPLKYNASFRNPQAFFRELNGLYKQQVAILNTYQIEKIVSNDFVKYASVVLKTRYILGVADFFGIASKTPISSELLKLPFKFDFSDSLMAMSTPDFGNAASLYNYYFINNFNKKQPLKYFKKMFNTASNHFHGFMKELLQGWLLEGYAAQNPPAFDSLYRLFLGNCRNQHMRQTVFDKISKIQEQPKEERTVEQQGRRNFSSIVDSIMIQDVNGRNHSMRALFSDSSITIVDCWASWCFPCIRQMPFLERIKRKCDAKANFVYLSFDEDQDMWKNGLKKFRNREHLSHDFILTKNSASLFSKYFNIKTIPRYILISKNGKRVLNDDMPLPSMEADFIKILNAEICTSIKELKEW